MFKKPISLWSLVLLCLGIFTSFSAGAAEGNMNAVKSPDPLVLAETLNEELNLDSLGLQMPALEYAVTGYENLLSKGLVDNPRYLTIVDYSQALYSRRFYLLDVERHELVLNTYVMHGRNSGGMMAETFSNTPNSNQSSIGFYLTGATYYGSRGYSLRLHGQEEEFNSNALARGVVLHGSSYINEERVAAGRVERSLGCPAIPAAQSPAVIDKIRGGSVMFVYHPSMNYLARSTVLNMNHQLPSTSTAVN